MGIGMEPPGEKDHVEHDLGAERCDRVGIDVRLDEGLCRARRDPFDIVHGEQRFRCPFPVDPGNDDLRVAGEIGAQAVGVAGLVGEVEFLQDCGSELLDERGGRKAPDFRTGPLEYRRELGDEAQIRLHAGTDVGPPDLEDDGATIVQVGAVDLRHRNGGKRLGIERGERLADRFSQSLLDVGPHHFEREGRRLAVKPLQFGDPVGRKKIAARGENLPELDEGGTQFLQRQPCACGQRRCLARKGILSGQTEPVDRRVEAIARQDPGDLGKAVPIPGRYHQAFQHGPRDRGCAPETKGRRFRDGRGAPAGT